MLKMIKIKVIPTQNYMYITYCKRANVRGGFNFAMFAVDDFFHKIKTTAIILQVW